MFWNEKQPTNVGQLIRKDQVAVGFGSSQLWLREEKECTEKLSEI